MIPFSAFETGLPYSEFMSRFGSPSDQSNWDRQKSRVVLTPPQTQLLNSFNRKTNIFILAGAWCGDCAFNCAFLEKFAEINPLIQIRYHDRDDRPDLQKELLINGGQRVPVAVFMSEDGFEVSRFGEKTLSEYRRKVQGLVPDSLIPVSNDITVDVTNDWLGILERVQWILRSSPRLRRLHGD
jgi:hypothetical protein